MLLAKDYTYQTTEKSNTQKNSYDLMFVTYLDMVSAFKTIL
jgi:hypothetical protein